VTTTLAAPVQTRVDQRAYRLTSIDMVRGVIIVIMALDHVRDFFMAAALQDPMVDPNVPPGLFFTRWITHFCAPVFVLLAGVSAGLMAERRSQTELGRFLLTRGLWLIVAEWVFVATASTFAPQGIPQLGGSYLVFMQVLWAIGASMIVLAAVQFLGRRACLILGLAIVCAHNLLDPVWPASALLDGHAWPLWVALHGQMYRRCSDFPLSVATNSCCAAALCSRPRSWCCEACMRMGSPTRGRSSRVVRWPPSSIS
jgi:uncharacterized membrane protein